MVGENGKYETAPRYRVRNWEKFQYYKDRCPPWIRLHFSILSSKDWVMLDNDARVLAIACMLIASRDDGKNGEFDGDPEYIKQVAYLKRTPDFTPLLNVKFIEVVNADACGCMQVNANVTTEQSRAETEESREEVEVQVGEEISPTYSVNYENVLNLFPNDTPDDVMAAWNEVAGALGLPIVRTLSEGRRNHVRRRLRDVWWRDNYRDALSRIKTSKFLTGRTDPPWKIKFDNFIRPDMVAKILEGNYHNDDNSVYSGNDPGAPF